MKMIDIINEKVPDGSAKLWWLGQMGLLVKMGDAVLCIDYFASGLPERQVQPPIPMAEMEGATFSLEHITILIISIIRPGGPGP